MMQIFGLSSKKYFHNLKICCVICLSLFLYNPVASSARDVAFSWSENPETIDGYRLYYKTGSSGASYDGSGATEGPSPVVVGNTTSFTLHGLSDSETYYFAITAYSGSVESGFTDQLMLDPVGVITSGRNVSFSWAPNPETVDGYRLYYKTGNSGGEYNGVGATEGPSPVSTGNITSYTLHGLSVSETYYFAITSYLGDQESGYSDELMVLPGVANTVLRLISIEENK